MRQLTPTELDAIKTYAAKYGRKWKERLSDDWYYARLSGPLHVLRNDLGPAWLVQFKLATDTRKRCADCGAITFTRPNVQGRIVCEDCA